MLLGAPPDMIRGAPSHRTRPPHDRTKASLKSIVNIIMEKAGSYVGFFYMIKKVEGF